MQKGSTGNRTFVGTWTPAVYTVSFSTTVPGEMPAQQVAYGATAANPSVTPIRDSNAFSGWYADYECTEPFDFAQAITGNTTVWAGRATKDSEGTPSGDASSGGSSAIHAGIMKASDTIPNTGDPSAPWLMTVSILAVGVAIFAWGSRRREGACGKGRDTQR